MIMIYAYTYSELSESLNSTSCVDDILIDKWKNLQYSGLFNYKLSIEADKILPGSFGFYMQLNPSRTLKRRSPQSMSSLTEPFDSEKFNFMEIDPDEIILDIYFETINEGSIIINTSPLTIGHCLLCPNREQCLPQRLTLASVEVAVRLMWLSGNKNLRIGYNSPGALASVNHLHFHLLYLSQNLPVENVKCREISLNLYELVDYPAYGFCLIVSCKSEIAAACKMIMNIIDVLIDLNIPHNIMMTFGESEKNLPKPDNKNVLRIIIFPRKDSFGCKMNLSFNLAFCELSGYVPVGNLETFHALTESDLIDIMKENTYNEFHIAKQSLLLNKQ